MTVSSKYTHMLTGIAQFATQYDIAFSHCDIAESAPSGHATAKIKNRHMHSNHIAMGYKK